MEQVDIDAVADDFDRHVLATPDIDRFGSSTPWIVPAAATYMPPREPFVFRGQAGYFAAMQATHARGFPYLEPFELVWGLGSPFIGGDVVTLVKEVVELLAARSEWQLALITGLTIDGPQLDALTDHCPETWSLKRGKQQTLRFSASLEGGLDGFMSRRSTRLRSNMRYLQKRSKKAGVTFEQVRVSPADVTAAYDRLQAVEARSWKARENAGISKGRGRAFYAEVFKRLVDRGWHRLMFARYAERDVGFILGVVFGNEYLLLQHSFDDALPELGIGNLLLLEQVAACSAEGVQTFHLGSDRILGGDTAGTADFKRKWTELTHLTETLVLSRNA